MEEIIAAETGKESPGYILGENNDEYKELYDTIGEKRRLQSG